MAERAGGDEIEVVERGDIFFLYRPKVEETDPSGLDDVQRFHLVLRAERKGPIRLLSIGRKRLPDVRRHEQLWGYVDAVTTKGRELGDSLREARYSTKTRGERTNPAARPAGEGRYALFRRKGRLHLAYALELPDPPGAVQRALNIAPQAAFSVAVANPDRPSPPQADLGDREADYPKTEQKKFRGRKFEYEDPHLLDFEGAELILVGARSDPGRAYGIDLDAQKEGDPAAADLMRALGLSERDTPIEPLAEGDWA